MYIAKMNLVGRRNAAPQQEGCWIALAKATVNVPHINSKVLRIHATKKVWSAQAYIIYYVAYLQLRRFKCARIVHMRSQEQDLLR
jgi:hypothetical protein